MKVNTYPERAGHVKNSTTSFDAATRVEKRGKVTREIMIYDALKEKPRTVSELGEDFNLPHEVISPRCGEMRSRGLLGPTGEQRVSKYGNKVDVLKVIAPYSRAVTKTKKAAARAAITDKDKLKTVLTHLQLCEKQEHHLFKAMELVNEIIAG